MNGRRDRIRRSGGNTLDKYCCIRNTLSYISHPMNKPTNYCNFFLKRSMRKNSGNDRARVLAENGNVNKVDARNLNEPMGRPWQKKLTNENAGYFQFTFGFRFKYW